MRNKKNVQEEEKKKVKVSVDTDLLGGSIRQVPERPQAVLHQTLAGSREVFTQSLHPTCGEQTS